MNFHPSLKLKPTTRLKTKIYSVGSHLPKQVIQSDDLFSEFQSEKNYNIAQNWMSKDMGIKERRVCSSDTKPSDLAIPAAREALEAAGDIPIDEIDMVLFCGIERDQSEPATAHTVQDALGIKARYAYDISNACYGFIEGIESASHYIASGSVRYALITTGEIPSRVMWEALRLLKKGVSKERATDIIGALSVGDAGGALILGPSGEKSEGGFQLFNTKTDSSHIQKCLYQVMPDGTIDGQMKMGPIVGASIWMHRGLIRETLELLGWETFDWVLMHQTGKRPFEKFSAMSPVADDRVIETYSTHGNVASATFPINYEKMLLTGKVCPGDRIGGIHSGSGLVVGEFGYTVGSL